MVKCPVCKYHSDYEPIAAIFGVVQSGLRALVFIGVGAAASVLIDRIEKLWTRARAAPAAPPDIQRSTP